MTDASGRTLSFVYNGAHLATASDQFGRQVQYQYNDGSANLTDVYDVNNGHWHFTYDAAHRMLTMSDPLGNTVTNHYNAGGVIDWQTDPKSQKTQFSYSGEETTVTDPMGNQARYYYTQGLKVGETRGFGTPQAATWLYRHDPNTLSLTQVIDPNGNATTMTYDSQANVLTTTDALGRTSTTTYNALNEPLTTTNPLNVTTTMTYDASGNVRTRSTPLTGTSQTRVTTYVYGDASHPGDVTSTIDPNGKTWKFSYDTYGNPTSTTDPMGDTATVAYNALGWRLSAVSPKGNVSGCNCASQYTATYSYLDSLGRTNQYGDVQTTTDPLGHVTTWSYDADRNVVTVKDGNGNTTQNRYDANNQVVEVDAADGTKTLTTYNADGTVSAVTDGSTNTTKYSYDSLARVTSTTTPATAVCPNGCTTSLTRDGFGNVLTSVDGAGRVTTYSYDTGNQLGGITYSDGVTPNVGPMLYNGNGQRTQVTDGTGTSRWTYDSLRRLTSYVTGAGATVAYDYLTPSGGYDLKDQVGHIVYPNSVGTVARVYDDAGRLVSVTDWIGRTTGFTYDANSNVSTSATPSQAAVTDSFGYNAADQTISVTDATSSSTLFAAQYVRDSNGQLASDSSAPASMAAFRYTPLNQVCYAGASSSSPCTSPPSGSQAFGYDGAGNLTQIGAATQRFDAAGEVCWRAPSPASGACGATPIGGTAYSFDVQGRRVSKVPSTGQATCYSYDQQGRLTSIAAGAGSSCTSPATVGLYGYDADGLRQSKTVGGRTTQFTWNVSGTLPVLLQEATGGITTSYIAGPGGMPVEQVSSSQPGITLVGVPTTAADASGTGGSLVVTLPGAIGAGDQILVATTFGEGVSNAVSTPSGYIAVGGPVVSATSLPTADVTQVFRKTAVVGDSSVTLSYSGAFPKAAVAVVYRGADPSVPVDVVSTGVTAGGTTVTASGVTRFPNERLVLLQGASYTATAAGSWTAPAGATEQRSQKDANSVNVGLSDLAQSGPGATGNLTSTFTTSGSFVGQPQLTAVLIGLQTPPAVAFYHHDQLGSTRILTDLTGATRASYTYDPYGNMLASTGPAITSYLYAGQYVDSESGLQYLRARYDDSSTGQFLSRDPLVAQTRSPYGYAADNPINVSDPSGKNSTSMSPDAQHCDKGGNWGGVDPQVEITCGNGDRYWTHHELTPTGLYAQACMAFWIGEACLTLTNSHCYFSGGPGIVTPGPSLGFGVTPNHSSDELIEGWSGHVGGQFGVGGGYAQSPNGVGGPYISIGPPGAGGSASFGLRIW